MGGLFVNGSQIRKGKQVVYPEAWSTVYQPKRNGNIHVGGERKALIFGGEMTSVRGKAVLIFQQWIFFQAATRSGLWLTPHGAMAMLLFPPWTIMGKEGGTVSDLRICWETFGKLFWIISIQ